jgi:alanine racemase
MPTIMDSINRQGSLENRSSRQSGMGVLANLYEAGPLRLCDRGLKTVKAYVSRSRLRHNAAILKKHCDPRVNFCAVVKANGYGHEARSVVSSLDGSYADSFAVSSIEEAEQIYPFVSGRTILTTCPVFGGIDQQLVKLAQIRGFHCTVCSTEALRYLNDCLDEYPSPLKVHLKVDTGMGRLGCASWQAIQMLQMIDQNRKLQLVGIYTHLATADDNDMAYTRRQLAIFDDLLAATGLDNDPTVIKHSCNTSATLRLAEKHYDMVRCGIGLYGYTDAGEDVAKQLGLLPVLKVDAPLVQVKTLHKGQSCGYGRTFVAKEDMVIGIVPAGYADGLRRYLSNHACMRAQGKDVPIIGRISMDLTIVDLSKVDNPHEGMSLTVIDDSYESPCNAAALARMADTIAYEILAGIGNRVKRQFVD